MKLCKNCRYLDFFFGDKPDLWCCTSPNNFGIDLVTGEEENVFVFCKDHRKSETIGCTKDGNWFKQEKDIFC